MMGFWKCEKRRKFVSTFFYFTTTLRCLLKHLKNVMQMYMDQLPEYSIYLAENGQRRLKNKWFQKDNISIRSLTIMCNSADCRRRFSRGVFMAPTKCAIRNHTLVCVRVVVTSLVRYSSDSMTVPSPPLGRFDMIAFYKKNRRGFPRIKSSSG